jgi:hypothetical protein
MNGTPAPAQLGPTRRRLAAGLAAAAARERYRCCGLVFEGVVAAENHAAFDHGIPRELAREAIARGGAAEAEPQRPDTSRPRRALRAVPEVRGRQAGNSEPGREMRHAETSQSTGEPIVRRSPTRNRSAEAFPDAAPPSRAARRRRAAPAAADPLVESAMRYDVAIREFKRRLIEEMLRLSGGNRTTAARWLGLERSYLQRLIKQLRVRAA